MSHNHEVIFGGPSSGKSRLVKQKIDEDIGVGREAWVIDYIGWELPSVRNQATSYASSPQAAERMLHEAVEAARMRSLAPCSEPPTQVTLTIDPGSDVLLNPSAVATLQQLLQMQGETGISVRLTVRSRAHIFTKPALWDALSGADFIECTGTGVRTASSTEPVLSDEGVEFSVEML